MHYFTLYLVPATLLSVDEVKSWAEHAQQLPPSVVSSFYNSRITGYDFPELLADDGALLESELGIHRQSLKRRIMRGMKMKLLGVGRAPEPPNPIIATPISCSKISISWGNGRNAGRQQNFPVHKYIIQRFEHIEVWKKSLWLNIGDIGRYFTLNRFSNQSSKGESAEILTEPNMFEGRSEPLNSWLTIFEGIDIVFIDSGLLHNTVYDYRIVSWNAVGHSDIIYFSCKISKRDSKSVMF